VPDESKVRSRIIQKIIRLVQERHFNLAGVDHQEWARRLRHREPDIVRGDREEFEAGVRAALSELKTSHTAFYSERPTRFPPQHTINATLSEITVNGSPRWMFVDVFEDGPAYLAGIRPGDLLLAVDGAEPVPGSLPLFGIGRTHHLEVSKEQHTTNAAVEVPFRKGSKQRPPLVEPVSIRHRMVGPGIGLLKILYFPGAIGIRFSNQLRASIDDLKAHGCERLIIDLRGNIGGSLGFAALASYLCSGREEIGYSVTPARLRAGYSSEELPRVPMPRTRAEALARLAAFAVRDKSLMLLTQGLSQQPFHGRTVILINQWTSSAGEMAAAFAAGRAAATLAGHTTKGNVLGAMNFPVAREYWLRVPVFGWFTYRDECLEGSGVVPTISVSSESPDDVRRDILSEVAIATVKEL
jgi:C-terminal processing protease CtpA/Prc